MKYVGLIALFYLAACQSGPSRAKSPNSNLLSEDQVNEGLPQVGKKVPPFEFEDRFGRKFSLKDFHGNVVFLNFWATWCGPCIEEFPSMDALNESLKSEAFTLVAVSLDDSWSVIETFLKQLPRRPQFLILRDSTKRTTNEIYGTTLFPETYLIGPDGVLLKKYTGAYNWVSPDVFLDLRNLIAGKTK